MNLPAWGKSTFISLIANTQFVKHHSHTGRPVHIFSSMSCICSWKSMTTYCNTKKKKNMELSVADRKSHIRLIGVWLRRHLIRSQKCILSLYLRLVRRWHSRNICAHLLLQEHQNCNQLLNSHWQEDAGTHQKKKISHVQRQRSHSKKVRGAQS